MNKDPIALGLYKSNGMEPGLENEWCAYIQNARSVQRNDSIHYVCRLVDSEFYRLSQFE